MDKAFASQADLEEKRITFAELGGGAYAYTAEGDPNTGVVVGDDSVMVLDTQATPIMASEATKPAEMWNAVFFFMGSPGVTAR